MTPPDDDPLAGTYALGLAIIMAVMVAILVGLVIAFILGAR